MNRAIINALFPDALGKIGQGTCALCGRQIDLEEFRDELSKKEFEISGLCQDCQDGIFLEDET
jgi:hypothetical protein